MAMSGKGQREAANAIASCRPFQNSTGSLRGTRGPTRDLGWLSSHADAHRIRELLSRATYVVWSYNTPISWVSETEDGDRQAYYVDEHHSMTTSQHQSVARMGLGEYEMIGERPRRERRAPVRNATPAQLLAEAERDRGTAVRAQMRYQPAQEAAEQRRIDERAGLRFPTPASATTAVEELVGSPRYQNGTTEESQERRMRRLLDPRYANPDWTPFGNGRHGNLPEGAEERDEERVEREQQERPWRP